MFFGKQQKKNEALCGGAARLELAGTHGQEVICIRVVAVDIRVAAVASTAAAVGAEVAATATGARRPPSQVSLGLSDVVSDEVSILDGLSDLPSGGVVTPPVRQHLGSFV